MIRFLQRAWWMGLAVAIVFGLWRLQIDVDVLNLLPGDLPAVQGLKLYEKHFTNAREVILTLRAPDEEQAERLAGELAAHLRSRTNLVSAVSSQAPFLEHPAELAELLAFLWVDQPPETFGALTNRLAPAQLDEVLEQTKEELRTSMSPLDMARRAFDPFNFLDLPALTNLSGLASEQGRSVFTAPPSNFRVISVESAADLGGYQACEAFLQAIRQTVEAARDRDDQDAWRGAAIHYTGRPVFVVEMSRSMRRDINGSVAGTALIIALLFWLTHRRWLPLLWLLTLLALVLVATVALGTLILGAVSVISLGFAAVLLGLAVDYAVVHYQEALAHPDLTVPEIRLAIAPSILWAAITTISAFLVLNLGGLPGLAQLGTLVAVGIGIAALVMVMVYLPPLFPTRRRAPAHWRPARWRDYFFSPLAPAATDPGNGDGPSLPGVTDRSAREAPRPGGRLWLTVLILGAAALILVIHTPGLDRTGDALRPARGEAETTLDELKSELGLPADPLWLMVTGKDTAEAYQRLSAAETVLDAAKSNHVVGTCLLPTPLLPRAEPQAANRAAAILLGTQHETFHRAALRAGFETNALEFTDGLVEAWARIGAGQGVQWPTNRVSQWLLNRFVVRRGEGLLAMGLVYPPATRPDGAALAALSARLAREHALLSSWELLGSTTLKRVQARLWHMVTPMVILVLGALGLAFRRPLEVLLGLAVLGLSGLCLLAAMSLAGWSWNLLNLMGLPLILGTGVDYAVFIQLALRRQGGDLALVQRSTGRALLLCGGTAIAGFGALGCSSNPGMASLGRVCAIGIGANMAFSIFLLPAWWTVFSGKRRGTETGASISPEGATPAPGARLAPTPASAPSALYRAGPWRAGARLARSVPAPVLRGLCWLAAMTGLLALRKRRRTVVQNLLPVVGNDERAVRNAVRRLYYNFALKLVDLWRLEQGQVAGRWLTSPEGMDLITRARSRGRGILFITLHLGNWEHGGLLLNQIGIPLTILTQAEPDDQLTQMRIASRRRCGVETLLIGRDSFAFIEVLKRLDQGAALAIALDRPPARGGVAVEFFGRRFEAHAAAAELARASGCALIGVSIVRRPGGYAARILPEFTYDRAALGNREARRALTQEILRAFEPVIRQDVTQWYQFVPIWPDGTAGGTSA